MAPDSNARSIGLALEWVAKITAVGLIMVVPAAMGQYADRWLGTGFLGIAGLLLGVVAGFWHLMRLVGTPKPPQQ